MATEFKVFGVILSTISCVFYCFLGFFFFFSFSGRWCMISKTFPNNGVQPIFNIWWIPAMLTILANLNTFFFCTYYRKLKEETRKRMIYCTIGRPEISKSRNLFRVDQIYGVTYPYCDSAWKRVEGKQLSNCYYQYCFNFDHLRGLIVSLTFHKGNPMRRQLYN